MPGVPAIAAVGTRADLALVEVDEQLQLVLQDRAE